MTIERTVKSGGKELTYESFDSLSLKTMKNLLKSTNNEKLIENKLETFGSIVKFTYKYKYLGVTYTEEYILCEIGEEENDDEKLAKALRIIYEKMAEDIVNNILLEN